MKFLVLCIALISSYSVAAEPKAQNTSVVHIPYMKRPSLHRVYADTLLELALESSTDKYGPYKILQQPNETVIERQLAELMRGKLSVAVAMPRTKWTKNALRVPFPIMKGLASYRLFFITSENKAAIEKVQTLNDLKAFKVGQGRGWSTADILKQHGFEVIYAPDYSTLFPMLAANRFQLLMRGVYEMEVELYANKHAMTNLAIADNIAIYTYLPMYFYVSKSQPELAGRIEYGLKKLHATGQFDRLFKEHFWSALKLLDLNHRKVFVLSNGNIDATYFEQDKPYLLDYVHQ